MTWLNFKLSSYAAGKGIIPETQVVTQPSVQTRDLMSFLGGLKTWSKQNGTELYLLKRDQMKGFDYLSPNGFYDACEAYGLPSSICDLDRAAQSQTRCFPQMAFGIAEPIIVEGVTKQGGPMSPFKSTLTTSLSHRYLNDIVRCDPDAVVISSISNQVGDPHLLDNAHTMTVVMTEATDDSCLVAKTHNGLQQYTLEMECFQLMYGWLTSWEKTTAHVLNCSGSIPKMLKFPSIMNGPGIDLWMISKHEVSISAVRKIVSQNVISWYQALLSLQPVLHSNAVRLDQPLPCWVHELLGFPFYPLSLVVTLPLDLGGFDFPSIT
ncbi:hypothetical protein C0993_010730 [Termitomyces sp. T159_Od127]|nr:hypothetical protein C0993_010730 [Termitomyces sp. T159_Od127]